MSTGTVLSTDRVGDVEELLAERGIDVDPVSIIRWVQRFTPLLIDAARPCRHAVGDRWFVDETYIKVAGVWRYVYRAVNQHDQVIDVYVSKRPNTTAARHFFETALAGHGRPTEGTTELAAPLLRVVEELIPEAAHDTEQYTNDRIEWDHSRLKARLRLMRGLLTDRTASVVIRGHAYVQNLRRGHYELGVEADRKHRRLAAACDELALTQHRHTTGSPRPPIDQRNSAALPAHFRSAPLIPMGAPLDHVPGKDG